MWKRVVVLWEAGRLSGLFSSIIVIMKAECHNGFSRGYHSDFAVHHSNPAFRAGRKGFQHPAILLIDRRLIQYFKFAHTIIKQSPVIRCIFRCTRYWCVKCKFSLIVSIHFFCQTLGEFHYISIQLSLGWCQSRGETVGVIVLWYFEGEK